METLLQPRVQRLLILLQVGEQLLRHPFLIYFLCQRGVVAGILQHTYLILHLNHWHHVTACLADMLHQRPESLIVCLEYILREATGYLQRLALLRPRPWESFGVLLKPQGRIARHGVLPCAKPQEHHLQLQVPCLLDGAVDEGVVELTFCRLKKFPVGRYQHRVETQRLHAGHHLIDILHTRRRRVAQFAT